MGYEKVGGFGFTPGQDYYNNFGKNNKNDTDHKGNVQLDAAIEKNSNINNLNNLNNQLNQGGKQNMTEYDKVEPGVWKPLKDGDSVEGILISVQNSTKYENNKIYHLECTDGKQLAIFGTTVLDDRMTFVKVGDKIKIVFKGTQKNSKQQDTKIFEVFKARA